MCLILVAWRANAAFPCVIAANRDELHVRAAAPAHWWSDQPQILAGRDLTAGGTWLGVTRSGRFAALTNFRGPTPKRTAVQSRGLLVSDFLESNRSVDDELTRLRENGRHYNGFNLIFCDGARLAVYESLTGDGRELTNGVYGLSNHLLDTPWPKVEKAKSRLLTVLGEVSNPAVALSLLRDDTRAADEFLPRTGVSLEWERLLSSAFIRGPDYGTRCSTVIAFERNGSATFDEWSWRPSGESAGLVSVRFAIGR